MINKPEVLIIHHTASAGDNKQFDAVNRYHKSISFPISSLGYYVGYHYFIEKDGTIRQARAHSDEGAHTIGWNRASIGVCLAGNFDYEQPTTAQIRTLQSLRDRLELPADLHRNRQENRTCPGRNFTLDLLEETIDMEDERKAAQLEVIMRAYPGLAGALRALLRKIGVIK